MIDVSKLSARYSVSALTEADAGEVLAIYRGNPQYFEYSDARPTLEQVVDDMSITPPGIDSSSKYYVGFYQDGVLVAVMDLIDGYPQADVGYVGFFMMNAAYQGKELGSAIVAEAVAYLKTVGKNSLRLAIEKDNPQSNRFWEKNGFRVVKEVDRNGRRILVAERVL